MDERLAAASVDPGLHGGDADFEFEGGGDAVAGFVAVVFGVLAVDVEVDEAGRDDVIFGVDYSLGFEGGGGDGGDDAVGDADGTDGIEVVGGADDAAVVDGGVEGRLGVGGGRRQGGEEVAAGERHLKSLTLFLALT